MKLELYIYTCADCAKTFNAMEYGNNSYGEFVLRSASGEAAYLDAMQDHTFNEVSRILETHENTKDLSTTERAHVLHKIYGRTACDKDSNGKVFNIGAHPPCPACGSQRMASWETKYPRETEDIPINPVTHVTWSKLSEIEKLKCVEKSLPEAAL